MKIAVYGMGPGMEYPSQVVYAVIAGLVRRSLRAGLRPTLLGLGPARELPALFIQSGTITARISSCIVIPRSFAIFLSWAYICGSRDCKNLLPFCFYFSWLKLHPKK